MLRVVFAGGMVELPQSNEASRYLCRSGHHLHSGENDLKSCAPLLPDGVHLIHQNKRHGPNLCDAKWVS